MLFVPDQFLGAHVRRILGRDNITSGAGSATCTPASTAASSTAQAEAHPDADLYIHPECGCATSALYLAGAGAVPADRVKILSTGEMVDAARLQHVPARCWWPPRSGCSTSCARPTPASTSSR